MCELSPVTFHGDTIFCVTLDNQPYAPMRPLVENMGLGWASQSQKLNSNKERWGVTIIVTPSEGGEQQTLCMPVRKLPAFLASINPRKVKPELREKIELYQRECDDALWDYWTKGRAERRVAQPDALAPEMQAQLHAIVAAKAGMLPKEAQRKAYAEGWTRFCRHFRIARYSQLPPSKMGEAVDYLVNVEWEAAKALPQGSSSEIPNNSPLGFPVPIDAPKQLKTLHAARQHCRFDFLPQAYSASDRDAAERHHLAEDLYKLQDCLWAALYNVCSAAARLRA